MGQNLDELFDVVDGQDRVTGQASRREVHARELWHRAVHVFVLNGKGEVFLHQRSLTKDSFPGLWTSSCAGHVAAGDEYDETALREMEEELGLRLSRKISPHKAAPTGESPHKAGSGDPTLQLQPLLKVDACRETGEEFVWVYAVRAEGPFALNPAEIQQGGWYSPADIDRWVAERPVEFAASFRFLWPRVRGALEA